MTFTVTLNGTKAGSKIYFTVTIQGMPRPDWEQIFDLVSACESHSDLLKLEKQGFIKISQ